MLASILSRMYGALPAVRERRDMRAALWHLEQGLRDAQWMLRRFEAQLTCPVIRLLDFDLENHPRYGDARRLLRYQAQVC